MRRLIEEGKKVTADVKDNKLPYHYHFQMELSNDMQGVGRMCHTNNNRIGFTLHTLLASLVQLPINFGFHRLCDSVQNCVKTCLTDRSNGGI